MKTRTFSIDYLRKLGGDSMALAMQLGTKMLDIKIAHYDISVDPSRPDYRDPSIFVFWHEYISLAVPVWAHSSVTMLVSQHRDANWLALAAERLGYHPVRGSTTRGGSSAVRELVRKCRGHSLGITPDGPKGPRRHMAMGPIFLASLLKMPIIPVGFGADRPIRMKTWDKFAVPRPLSRARMVMGPRMEVPRKLRKDQMEPFRVKMESALNALTKFAEDWAASGRHLENVRTVRQATCKSTFAAGSTRDQESGIETSLPEHADDSAQQLRRAA